MKKILCFGVLILGLLMCISEANAITYTLTDGIYNRVGGWDGGAFKVNDSFLTFCLERSEYFYWNYQYNGTIDAYAYKGGGGADLNQDYISDATAYLYIKYLNNGYHNDSTPVASDAAAIAFQKAIWALEQEIPLTDLPSGSTEKALYDEAIGAVISGFANNGQVMVLNLYSRTNSSQYPAQSQLIRVPEPTTILLLGVGLLGLVIVPRFRKKTI